MFLKMAHLQQVCAFESMEWFLILKKLLKQKKNTTRRKDSETENEGAGVIRPYFFCTYQADTMLKYRAHSY